MLDYLKTWRKEHEKIQADLFEVVQLDIFSRAGKMKLQELKRVLELHLLDEDQNFYPALKKAAETDAGLRRELFLFAADMEKITAAVQAFFRKEESDPLGADIAPEFSKISAMIKSRITREENILMKEFTKLAERKTARAE